MHARRRPAAKQSAHFSPSRRLLSPHRAGKLLPTRRVRGAVRGSKEPEPHSPRPAAARYPRAAPPPCHPARFGPARASARSAEAAMNDQDKTREQLLDELRALRAQPARRENGEEADADVTERTRAEEALRDSQALYHALVEGLPLSLCRKDRDGRYTFGNSRFADAMGLPLERVLGKTDFDLSPPDLAAKYYGDDRRVLETGLLFEEVEEYHRPNGERYYIQMWKTPVFNARGEVIGTQGLFWDVTEQRKAAEALRASEERYRRLFERNLAGVIHTTADGAVRDCNEAFARMLGYAREEVLALNAAALWQSPADRAVYVARLRAARVLTDYELCLRRKDGRPAWLLGNVSMIDRGYGPAEIQGIYIDVTERRQLEEQVRQAQKLEAVGQLAGGIAHDFNNLLTAILGNLSLVLANQQPGANAELLEAGEKAALRAAELTSQLLGFSRRTLLKPRRLNVNATAEETVRLLRRTIDPRIVIDVQADPGLWPVQADPGQMSQVLMNLCLNARDAMPQGGRLTLRTENVVLDEAYARLHLEARAGEYVRLRVADTGHGIPPEVLPRIFEPFFTTKGPGRGTGLGLAMVFGIVKQHRGWLDCDTAPGRGTRFDVYLPRSAAAEQAAAAEAAPAAPQPAGGSETVLLVDDEPLLRGLGRAILERHGYHVVLAEDGEQAVKVYEQRRGRIDLVLLDLTMPRMSGREAFARLLEVDPGVRVLFASGYSAEQVNAAGHPRALGFVAKPYRA